MVVAAEGIGGAVAAIAAVAEGEVMLPAVLAGAVLTGAVLIGVVLIGVIC